MEVGLVDAAVGGHTSGRVGRDGIGGVSQVLPETSVHVLLHEWEDEKAAEGIQGHHGLHKVKALHAEGARKQIPEKLTKRKYLEMKVNTHEDKCRCK